ncbi:MAG TPA: ribbon-helix-helix protein, CopG family [Allocoleopsis sp.]
MALGTFKIDDDLWKHFQEKAKADGSNASALIKQFIQRYLAEEISINDSRSLTQQDIEALIDSRIKQHLEAVEQRLGELSAV